MKNKSIIAFFLIIATILVSFLWFIINEISKVNRIKSIALDEKIINDECTEFAKNQNETVLTMANNSKISPNAIIIFKTYYKECKHIKNDIENVPNSLINATEKELKEQYEDWEVKGFSNSEIVLYTEKEGYCGEHYKLKENNGVLSIYQVDNDGKEILKENTDINVEFLTEEDKEKIREGLNIIGEKSLNRMIEDFE